MMKKIMLLLLTLALFVGVFSTFSMVASAETAEPQMSIAYCNLSFRDTVCIKYAVASNVSDVKILIWTSPESEYTVGTHDSEITEYYTEDIGGVSHMIFDYTKLTAKQMTDVVYARAYAVVDGVDYYSAVNKYSILQYAYNKLGKTATATDDEELKEVLAHMLAYGTAAQKYFDYKEDRLATADWYQIKVTDGFLDDGSMSGLYLPGDKVTITAPETNANGEVFSHWEDSNGDKIATTATYEVTVETANEAYTPGYVKYTVITTAEELAAIANDPSGQYILGNDINYNGENWTPIENFSGVLDGNGYRIYNYSCGNGTDENTYGFVKINTGVIKNIVFDEFNFTYAYDNNNTAIAGVIAAVNSGTIENCELRTGQINLSAVNTGTSTRVGYIGGVVGQNTGTVINVINKVDVTVLARNYIWVSNKDGKIQVWVGGIVGRNEKTVEKCLVESDIVCTNISRAPDGGGSQTFVSIGGIVGGNAILGSSTVKECAAYVDIVINCGVYTYSSYNYTFSEMYLWGGAIVGDNFASIEDCLGIGSITATNEGLNAAMRIGGAVGVNKAKALITNVYTDVDVKNGNSGKVSRNIGGFVGENESGASVIKCVSIGNVDAHSTMSNYGAFVGLNNGGLLSHCYYSNLAKVTVDGNTANATNALGTATSLSELQSEDFIYNTLYWEVDVWEVVDGLDPTLKCVN